MSRTTSTETPWQLDPLAADNSPLSPENTPHFNEVVASRLTRRSVLRGGLGMAAMTFFGAQLAGCGSSNSGFGFPVPPPDDGSGPSLGFSAVPVSAEDTVVVPSGYSAQPFLRWGEPITGSYPHFNLNNTGEEQGMQVGMHHDGMHYFPIEGEDPWQGSSKDGLIVMNHEYVEPRLMHAAAVGQAIPAFGVPLQEDGTRDPDQVLKEINSHGVTVVRVQKDSDGRWSHLPDARNRRITGLTPMAIAGPLRGDDALVTPYSLDATMTRGTLNNCSHGVTPWNTYLTCEENWWFYFHTDDPVQQRPPSLTRYRVGSSVWRWHLAASEDDAYKRFDLTTRGEGPTGDYRNEAHNFGYIVEIDPFDPDSVPVKRTHLGRFSHEGVVFAPVAEGRPVVLYSGDDSAGEYIYKFVSRDPYHADTASGALMDAGTLYVARFNDDGSGDWLALVPGQSGLSGDNGFGRIQDILLNTRGAADVAGATRMDRPEWGAVDPQSGEVYFTLTNNASLTAGGVNGPNPRPNNLFGQIVRWREEADDHTAGRFQWELFVLAGPEGDSRDLQGQPLDEGSIFACPDGLWIDPDRRIWIQTDMLEEATLSGPLEPFGNNAMLAANPVTGEIRRFLTGPIGQEITGCVATPDQTTLFINVQHPGGAMTSASDFAEGRFASHWPDGGDSYPRSATVAITRLDGGRVGE